MKAPEWATHKITFPDLKEGALVVYYNQHEYEGFGLWNERKTWEDVCSSPERYMGSLEALGYPFNLTRVLKQVVNK